MGEVIKTKGDIIRESRRKYYQSHLKSVRKNQSGYYQLHKDDPVYKAKQKLNHQRWIEKQKELINQ